MPHGGRGEIENDKYAKRANFNLNSARDQVALLNFCVTFQGNRALWGVWGFRSNKRLIRLLIVYCCVSQGLQVTVA